MSVTTNKNASAAKATSAKKSTLQSDQFVYTHCRQNESCNGEAGYQMRLRTCANQQMQDFTERLSYEPPDNMIQLPESAPHRLAWLRCPVDESTQYHVLVHSRYLGKDTSDRWGNYLTRTIFYSQRIRLKRVLQCWGSPDWDDTDFGDKGIEFSAKFPGLPSEGEYINDEQLRQFLSDENFPGRVGSISPNDRRRLLAWTTTACLRAVNSSSNRIVYLHAEPWLVALLLYGVATIIPGGFLGTLTFSTYEKMGQRLRSFQSATVVGTITDDPQDGLRDEFLESQGFVVDTFTQRCSPEAEKPLFHRLDDYVFLAAQGEWTKLEELHSLFALEKKPSPKTLGQAWQVHSERDLLLTHRDTLPDTEVVATFRRLRDLELGESLLEEKPADDKAPNSDRKLWRESLWDLLRAQCVRQPELRHEFADILQQQAALNCHFQELVDLIHIQAGDWRGSWHLYRELWEDSSKSGREDPLDKFKELLTPEKLLNLDLSTRLELLDEYKQLRGSEKLVDSQFIGLLILSEADHVWDFTTADPPFPVTWTGQALAASVCQETAKEIVQFLLGANEEDKTYGDLWMGFKNTYDMESQPEHRRQKLELMFATHPAEVLDLFFLLKSRLKFSDDDLSPGFFKPLLEEYWKQLETSPKKQYGWMHHLCDIKKVEAILPFLGRDRVSEKIWDTVLEAMGLGLLLRNSTNGDAFLEIIEWTKENPAKFSDETQKTLKKIVENWKKISSMGIAHVPLMIAAAVLLGIAVGWGANLFWPLSNDGIDQDSTGRSGKVAAPEQNKKAKSKTPKSKKP